MKPDNQLFGAKPVYILILIFLTLLAAGGLYLLSLYNYTFFHTLIELAAIITAFAVFIIGWNTRKFSGNNMIIILAVGYLSVGLIDLLHTLTFESIGIFPGLGSNMATQFWISARYIEGAALMLAALYLGGQSLIDPGKWLNGFLVTSALFTAAVFSGYFPDSYLEGQGLTTFKIASEYIISAVIIAAGLILWKKRDLLEKNILSLLLFAGAFTVMSEMSFTLYDDVQGFFNYLGHIFKLFSIVLLYNALVHKSLTNPFQFLFGEIADINKKLAGSEKKYRDLVEQSTDWVWETDPDGRYIYSNPRAEALTGYSLNEILGSPFTDFMVPDEAGKNIEFLREVAAERKPFFRVENTLLHKDGHPLIFESSGTPIIGGQGELCGYRGITRNITRHKMKENELIQAREKAGEALRAKSNFLARMSHEIRSPINVIMGTSEILAESELTPAQKEWAEMVKDSAGTLLDMLTGILDYSEADSGNLTLDHTDLNLSSLVEDTVSSYKVKAGEKGLQLSFHADRDIPGRVLGDPVRIQQVLASLLDNAIKYTARGNITVKVQPATTARFKVDESAAGGKPETFPVHFSVQDEGIGLQPDQVDYIFEGFSQPDTGEMNGQEGPGIGLPLSKKLVELMGGSIGVNSSLNKGSTFYFTIPFALPGETDRLPEPRPAEKSPRIKTSTGHAKSLNILLVEDKPMNQKLAEFILKKNGHDVTKAKNGREALTTLESRKFDLILMDIHMPEMDGLEATSRIRAAEEKLNRYTPIIAMTAYAMQEDLTKCLQAGMDYCVTKPINTAELYHALETVMKNIPAHTGDQAVPPDSLKNMLERVDGNQDLMEELANMFFEDYPHDLAALKEALETRDAERFASSAHGLKGELGNLGMNKAFETVSEAEKLAKMNKLDEAARLLEQLEAEVASLEQFFKLPDWRDYC